MRSSTAHRRMVIFPFFHTWVIVHRLMYVSLYSFSFLKLINTLSPIPYVCSLLFLFSSWLFLSMSFCLCLIISSQLAINRVFNIMSSPNTSWPGVACSIMWYVLLITKDVAASIHYRGSNLYFFLASQMYVRGLL